MTHIKYRSVPSKALSITATWFFRNGKHTFTHKYRHTPHNTLPSRNENALARYTEVHWSWKSRIHTHSIFLQRAYTSKLCMRVMHKNSDKRLYALLFMFNSHPCFFIIVSPRRNLYKYCVIYQWHHMFFLILIMWIHHKRRKEFSWAMYIGLKKSNITLPIAYENHKQT